MLTSIRALRLTKFILQAVAATGGPIKSEYTILYGSVAIIFLISGLQLSTQKLRANLFNWRLHLIVQGISFIIIPVIWLGASVLAPPPPISTKAVFRLTVLPKPSCGS